MSLTRPSLGPAVALSGIEVRIDGRTILHHIDWTIEPAERWVLLGPNGSGKTTLVQVTTMGRHPTSGTVSVLDRKLGSVDVRDHRRKIGVVSSAVANQLRPGIAAVDLVMSAINGALEPWWHQYTSADRERARLLLARFGVDHLAEHTFGTLSSGEQQRVLLARALIADPRLVVLDEPAAGLDLGGREMLLGDLADLARDPGAPPLVLVTHHLEEIPLGFTHALLLRDGTVVAKGPIASVLTDDHLSRCFGLGLQVGNDQGRWWARTTDR